MHTENTHETHTYDIRETAPPNHKGHLLHKVTHQRLRDAKDLPNTQKKTQKRSQNKETKKYVPSKITIKYSIKFLN